MVTRFILNSLFLGTYVHMDICLFFENSKNEIDLVKRVWPMCFPTSKNLYTNVAQLVNVTSGFGSAVRGLKTPPG
jgi:hypothetical protein